MNVITNLEIIPEYLSPNYVMFAFHKYEVLFMKTLTHPSSPSTATCPWYSPVCNIKIPNHPWNKRSTTSQHFSGTDTHWAYPLASSSLHHLSPLTPSLLFLQTFPLLSDWNLWLPTWPTFFTFHLLDLCFPKAHWFLVSLFDFLARQWNFVFPLLCSIWKGFVMMKFRSLS